MKLGLPVLLVLMLLMVLFYYNNYSVYSVINIDINPSFELNVSAKDKVLKIKALNDDAEEIVKEIKMADKHVEKVIEELSEELEEKGYLTEEEREIFLTVRSKDEKKVKELRERVNKTLRKNVKENSRIYNQGVNDEDIKELKDLAEKNEISLGKTLFIKGLLKLDSNLKFEDLAKMSFKDLVELAKTYKKDLADDDDDDYDDLFEDLDDDDDDDDDDNDDDDR